MVCAEVPAVLHAWRENLRGDVVWTAGVNPSCFLCRILIHSRGNRKPSLDSSVLSVPNPSPNKALDGPRITSPRVFVRMDFPQGMCS